MKMKKRRQQNEIYDVKRGSKCIKGVQPMYTYM